MSVPLRALSLPVAGGVFARFGLGTSELDDSTDIRLFRQRNPSRVGYRFTVCECGAGPAHVEARRSATNTSRFITHHDAVVLALHARYHVGALRYCEGVTETDKAAVDSEALRARFARIRLLNEELDKLTTDASERTASVTNKASFLAVSAGVLVAASTVQLWTRAPLFGVVALALACVALACAAVAVRPGMRLGIQARRLVDRYADTTMSALAVESQIVEDKAASITQRETDLRARAAWVWIGFAGLAVAAASLAVVFGIEILGA